MIKNNRFLLVFLLFFMNAVQGQKLNAIVIDDHLGQLQGLIKYDPYNYNGIMRFWEAGVNGSYKIDVKSVREIHLDGGVLLRRFFIRFYQVDKYDSVDIGVKPVFMRLLYDGHPIRVWERCWKRQTKYYFENRMNGEFTELAATYTRHEDGEYIMRAAYQDQIKALAAKLNISVPSCLLEENKYEEEYIVNIAKVLDKDPGGILEPIPERPVQPLTRWSVGIRGTYGKYELDHDELLYKLSDFRITGPTTEVQIMRDFFVASGYGCLSLGGRLGISRLTGKGFDNTGSPLSLSAHEYSFGPLLSANAFPYDLGNVVLGFGFGFSGSYRFRDYTFSNNKVLSNRPMEFSGSTFQTELNLICLYKDKWRFECVLSNALYGADMMHMENLKRITVGVFYRW